MLNHLTVWALHLDLERKEWEKSEEKEVSGKPVPAIGGLEVLYRDLSG